MKTHLNGKDLIAAISLFASTAAFADTVPLQNATATFSQFISPESYSVAYAIDGVVDNRTGWAVGQLDGIHANGFADPQTAAFETVTDVGFTGGTLLTFTLIQAHTASIYTTSNDRHNLGRFRISVTTDPRDTFADGLETGGDVTANWTVLDPITFSSTVGTPLTELSDHSILAGGANPSTDTYIVSAETSLTGITGIRLEALADPSLPDNGPGRREENGNFVLSEFQVDAAPVPEGGAGIAFVSAVCGMLAVKRSRNQDKEIRVAVASH
jgi:hypothetical protein